MDGSAKDPGRVPTLEDRLNRLEAEFNGLFERVSRLERRMEEVLNPRPEPELPNLNTKFDTQGYR